MISTGFVFILSKLWFFGLLGGGIKRQKITTRNDKKFCLSSSVSQEPYIIWLSFMVHMCKMIISPGVLFFKIMIFWVVRKGWEVKKAQNDNHELYDHNFQNICVKR